jgi:hypothetical protein
VKSSPRVSKIDRVTARLPDPGPIVEFFVARPDLTAAMLRDHVDDGTGHCAGCRWWQSAQPVWPCPTAWYAHEAKQRLQGPR